MGKKVDLNEIAAAARRRASDITLKGWKMNKQNSGRWKVAALAAASCLALSARGDERADIKQAAKDCRSSCRDDAKSCRTTCAPDESGCRKDCSDTSTSCIKDCNTTEHDDLADLSSCDPTQRLCSGGGSGVPGGGSPGGLAAADGTPLSCMITNPSKGRVGQAVSVGFNAYACNDGCTTPLGGGYWKIEFRPAAWQRYPAPVQKFLFAHECGHVNGPDMSEQTANCWGAKYARDTYGLSDSDWAQVFNLLLSVFRMPSGPYPAGPVQVTMIRQCLASP
jgi:hypothetical protein